MNNVNTMSKREFIFDHIFFIVVSFICYKSLLFRSLHLRSRSESVFILCAMLIVLSIIGMAINLSARRNNLSLFTDTCMPLGIYALLTYFRTIPGIWIAAIVAASLFSLFYCWAIVSARSSGRRRFTSKKLIHCLLGTRTVFSICFGAIVLMLGAGMIFGNTLISSGIRAEIPSAKNELTIADNMDTVMNLREEKWSEMSTLKKLDTLQTIANIEASGLGLPHELNVALGALDETTVARYADADHTITVNIDYFDSYTGYELLTAICHEAYHAYQYRLCNAYDSVDDACKSLRVFRDVPEYKNEFAHYLRGDDNFMDYYNQVCETNARAYAERTVETYIRKTDLYLKSRTNQKSV